MSADMTYQVYLHDGTSFVEVTDYVAGWSSRRGRNRELDTFSAGTFTVSLRNYDGRFLPEGFTGTTSPYGADVAIPGREFYVRSREITSGTWRTAITGFVEDTTWTYDNQQVVGARISGTDPLGRLARYSFTADYWINAEPRTQLLNLLSQSGWDTLNDLQLGLTTDSSSEFAYIAVTAGQNTLAACQQVVNTEGFARLFADRDSDDLVWQGRYYLVGATSAATFGDGGVPIESTNLAVGSDLLFNRVIAKAPTTAEVVEEDATSQTTYGVRSLSRTDLLFDAVGSVRSYAETHLETYSDPQSRLAQLTVNLFACTAAQADTTLARDIGDLVTVTFTPRGADEIDLDLVIEGISHTVAPDTHRVTFELSPAPSFDTFLLDTDELDTDRIGF